MTDKLVVFRTKYRGRSPAFWSSMTPFGFFADGFAEGRHAEHVATGRWANDCQRCIAPAGTPTNPPESTTDQSAATVDAASGLSGERSRGIHADP